MTTPVVTPATQPAAQEPASAPAAEAKPAEPSKPAEPAAKPAPRALNRKPAQPVTEPVAVPAAAAPAAAPTKSNRTEVGSRALTAMRNKLEAAERDAAETRALREELGHYAKAALESAPEKARKYVLAKHKDDPKAQLAELRALRESGLLEEPKASPVGQPAANTAPPRAPVADNTDPDVAAARRYAELKNNPSAYIIAQAFLAKNNAAIKRGEQKLAAKN